MGRCLYFVDPANHGTLKKGSQLANQISANHGRHDYVAVLDEQHAIVRLAPILCCCKRPDKEARCFLQQLQ